MYVNALQLFFCGVPFFLRRMFLVVVVACDGGPSVFHKEKITSTEESGCTGRLSELKYRFIIVWRHTHTRGVRFFVRFFFFTFLKNTSSQHAPSIGLGPSRPI